ncbi:hypothetical protein NQZ68_036612 [Dissostichus eleginoides]|nr:hypothetical protein NQZ68_036612 [Dissostichus eleginoides]
MQQFIHKRPVKESSGDGMEAESTLEDAIKSTIEGSSAAYLRHSRFGDLNPTPFRSAVGDVGHRPTLQNGVRPSLRTD